VHLQLDGWIQDAEYVGSKINNEAELCILIVALHRAVACGFTAVSVRGIARLVSDPFTGQARCTTFAL
jgi:hypothetical protein